MDRFDISRRPSFHWRTAAPRINAVNHPKPADVLFWCMQLAALFAVLTTARAKPFEFVKWTLTASLQRTTNHGFLHCVTIYKFLQTLVFDTLRLPNLASFTTEKY